MVVGPDGGPAVARVTGDPSPFETVPTHSAVSTANVTLGGELSVDSVYDCFRACFAQPETSNSNTMTSKRA